ncbi:serine hydrolase [Mycobacteriaceae bacterium 1482268.1]|nr:serine hydrolase [Mycobacteriaceae bacterium 1482268.1]
MSVVVTLVVALACGCADAGPAGPAGAAQSIRIDTNTPQGLRAKQIMDMLNSDWPIGPNGIRTLAAPEIMDDVGVTMDKIWWDRPFTLTDLDIGAGHATLHVLTSYQVPQTIELRTNDAGLVDRFDVSLVPPVIKSWQDIDTEIAKTGAKYSYQVSKVHNGKCSLVAGTNTDLSLPLASIFKLYVLLAVSNAVKDGSVTWEDQLRVTKEGKAVGAAGLDEVPDGTTVSVRTAAQQMISASDNMATDLLINRLGAGAVERALASAGHHDPASMTPFPTTHELFSIGWGKPNLREQWQQVSSSQAGRARLFKETDARPYDPDPERTHVPASDIGAEWYGSAADICRVHAALQASAVGAAAPVKQILSAIPGIDLDRAKWPYIGAKGGNLPGDLTFSWYAVDRTGQPYVVSFQLNWPKFRSQTAAGWLLSIVHQTFDLIPV